MMNTNPHVAGLSARRRHAVLVSAALVSRHGAALAGHLRRALESALTEAEVTELILQSLLFDGYPCALEGLIVLTEVLGEATRKKTPREPYSPENLALWRQRGLALCSQIYGYKFVSLLRHVEALSPSLKEWMVVEGYGRILSRPGLDLDLRELGIIAILAVKNRNRQLQSHIRGALNMGITPSEVLSSLNLCKPYGKVMAVRAAMSACRRFAFKKS